MYDDSPIVYKLEDKLNRTKFADSIAESIINLPKRSDSIVVGLMGGWGTGKSSLLNLTEIKLEGYVKILRFNPWNYYSQQMLFSSFFDELIGCLNLNEKISALFQKYKYKIIGTGIAVGSSVVPELSLLNNFIPDSEYKTLNSIKDKLDELFEKQPKTVVIIDDIDRLSPTEVKQIFQLVKSLANFPNVIYILAFDKNYVNFALSDWNMALDKYSYSEEFIDKIIQVPLTIPKFDDEDLFKLFEYKFNKVLKNHNNLEKNLNTPHLYILISSFFRNIRDINRFCNSLDFYMYSIGSEVSIFDFALVNALQIFAKDVYDEIKYNKDLLTNVFLDFDEPFNENEKNNLKSYLTNLIEKEDSKFRTPIRNVLSNLFPKANMVLFSSFTPERTILSKRRQYGIMDEEYFDMYFTFDTTNKLSKSRILSIVNSSNEGVDLKLNLLRLKKRDLLFKLIIKLNDHVDKFSKEGIKNIVRILIENFDDFFADDFSKLRSSDLEVIYFIIELSKSNEIDEKEFIEIINKSKNNNFKVFLIYDVVKSDLFSEKSKDSLKSDIAVYLKNYFEDTPFSQIEDLRSLLWCWSEFAGFDIVDRYVKSLSEEHLVLLVSEFVNDKTIVKEHMIEYNDLKHIVELIYIKNSFNYQKNDRTDIYVGSEDIIDMFLEHYPTDDSN